MVSGQTIATCGVLCDGDKQCNGFTTDALPSNTCWFYDYVQSLVVSGSPHRHVCKLSHVTNFKLFSIYSTIHILRVYIYVLICLFRMLLANTLVTSSHLHAGMRANGNLLPQALCTNATAPPPSTKATTTAAAAAATTASLVHHSGSDDPWRHPHRSAACKQGAGPLSQQHL